MGPRCPLRGRPCVPDLHAEHTGPRVVVADLCLLHGRRLIASGSPWVSVSLENAQSLSPETKLQDH